MSTNVDPRIASDEILQCSIIDRMNEALGGTEQGSPVSGQLPPLQDVKNAYMLMQEYTKRHFPLIPYLRLLTTEDELDDVHGEIPESQKRWSGVIQIRAFPNYVQVTQPMTNYGIEDARTIQLLITVPDLVQYGLATQDETTFQVTLTGRIGDRFYYHFRDYKVLTYAVAAWWANTDVPLYYRLESELRRPSSADTWGMHG